MEYTLSVVIPNYNNSKFLTKCIESVVSQSYEKLVEILVVDDCSTDNSREIISELASKYPLVKPIFLEKNGKVSAARNAGLNVAIGEYITFVDADDYYYNPDKLKNEMELIKKNFEMYGDTIAYSSIVNVSNDRKDFRYPKAEKSWYLQGYVYEKLLMDVNSGKVFRDYCIKTEILRELGGYNTSRSLFEDFELTLKVTKKCFAFYTGEYGTAYRDSINGLSKVKQKTAVRAKTEIVAAQIRTEPALKRFTLTVKKEFIQILKRVYHRIKVFKK